MTTRNPERCRPWRCPACVSCSCGSCLHQEYQTRIANVAARRRRRRRRRVRVREVHRKKGCTSQGIPAMGILSLARSLCSPARLNYPPEKGIGAAPERMFSISIERCLGNPNKCQVKDMGKPVNPVFNLNKVQQHGMYRDLTRLDSTHLPCNPPFGSWIS